MMGWIQHHQFSCVFWMVFFTALTCISASSYISDGVFMNQITTGRNLLQQKSGCPVNFEFQNYTIITSQCKGPQYPPDLCCKAFKEFACPFADQINDLTNDCATTMFSYINLYGKYPPGLFASECKEGKNGLECPALPPQLANQSGSMLIRNPSAMLTLATSFVVLLLMRLI